MVDTQELADLMKGGVTDATDPTIINGFLETCKSVASALDVSWFADTGLSTARVAGVIRGSVMSRLDRITAVCRIAASRGYILPDNPVAILDGLNKFRSLYDPLHINQLELQDLAKSADELSRIAVKYDAGVITFARSQPAAQVAAFEVSVDGISGQSGDPLADILGYQPDGDFVKRKRAQDALAKLDFSKRQPYMLFTADVIVDGKRRDGTIICWQRMHDAAGYMISKRDVFSGVTYTPFVFSNIGVGESTAELLADNYFRQVLSFYDWVREGEVVAFVDTETHDDTLFAYKVNGLQYRAPATPFLFEVPTRALYLTPSQVAAVTQLLQQEAARFVVPDPDSISPYPAIAQVVFGDRDLGWILAGCNMSASRKRGENVDQTRALAYIGSKSSLLLAQAAAGKFVVPNDIQTVHSNVESAVTAFGISQALLAILDGIGVTIFAAGKDDPLGIQPTQEAIDSATGGLAKILSAIDPATATLNPHVLLAALSVHTNTGTRYSTSPITTIFNGPGLTPPPSTNTPPPTPPALETIVGTNALDLTVYDGISSFMELIRTIYDFYPGSLT